MEEENFDRQDFTQTALPAQEFEECTFRNCNFSNVNLNNVIFSECEFVGCDFSLAALQNTALREVSFHTCKMLGLQFLDCNEFLFSVEFIKTQLDHSSFYQRSMKGTTFKSCRLVEVDFAECDLTGASFDECDLSGAQFSNTILDKADLRTAQHFIIDPERNRLKKARFSRTDLAGLLQKYDLKID